MMKKNERLGAILALLGALLGIVGHFVIFLKWYEPAMMADSAEPGCEILLKYVMPALFDVGILGGALFAVSGYGFLTAWDGQEIYFHRNSVLGINFENLEIGMELRYVADLGEKGLQATTVRTI